jgi:PAS domain S-box-containing protein
MFADLQRSAKGGKSKSRWLKWLVGLVICGTLIFTIGLSQQVISDLERQRSASSDNVQWTLTQVEVEYVSFLLALKQHLHDLDGPLQRAEDLSELRRQFDVFYSRVYTLQQSSLFSVLRADPDFADPLAKIGDFLERTVPLIDGADDVLESSVVEIRNDARAIQKDIRSMALAGLSYFVTTSDALRLETASTLSQLAALSATLLLVLTLASVFLLYVNRVMRGREEELVQTNLRMNTVISTALDAVIVSNTDGKVLEFNPAAERIFGYSPEETRGKSIGELLVPDHLREGHEAGMKRMKEGGKRHIVGKGRVQLEAKRKSGEVFPVELALQSASYGDQEVMIGFLRDISRRVATQAEVLAARDRALAGEKTKSDFLTMMSHEIRTPLNGILGNLSLLKNSKPTPEQGNFIRNMEVSGEVLLHHVDSVLDIARFEAGKLSVLREPTDIGALLQEIVDGQGGYAASRGNVIKWRWTSHARPAVATDKQRLRQILLNLVGNAIKFTENGSIVLEVEQTPSETGDATPVYEFRVIDTGMGISEDEVEKIFEDFHTNDPSIGRSAGGTGLGLGIARRFVEAMGGSIGVESTPGQGSAFWVRLPMPEVDPHQLEKRETDNVAEAPKLNLLVVEDNEINLTLIVNMLELDGHRVTTAQNGREGVAAAMEHRFDAILMDISMPVMDGPTATRRIRTGGGPCADVPIIAVSANVLPQAVENFREAGMTAFLGKPLQISSLRKVLTATMSDVRSGLGTENGNDDNLADLRRDLGEALVNEFIARFIQEGDDIVLGLVWEAHDTEAQTDLAAQCHKLAGSAAMFGVHDLRDALVDIENMVKSGTTQDIQARIATTQLIWEQRRSHLQNAIQSGS